MKTIKKFERAILLKNFPKSGLVKGDVGTIVEIYNSGEGYEVEFFAMDGSTIAVKTLRSTDIRSVSKKEILHSRELA